MFNIKLNYNIFIIKTNSYAGNFERQMCAYITGHIGDCEVGSELVDESIQELFDGFIDYASDNYGCSRPCTIIEEDLKYSNVGILMDEYVDICNFEHLQLMKDRAIEYGNKNNIKILGFSTLKVTPNIVEIELND